MNRTETEAAISGYLPRRARRHLPAIMAAVDAHAAAGREDLDRVAAEGHRRQQLVAEESRRIKAENAELGKQVRVLVEERAAALAEGNRLRQERAEQDQAFGGAVRRIHDLTAEVGEAAAERDRLRQELAGADAQLEIRTNMITNLEAERDRLRGQLADAPKLTIRDLSGCSCQYTVMPDGSFSRTLPRAECRADGEVQRSRRCVGSSGQTSNDGGPAQAPDGTQ